MCCDVVHGVVVVVGNIACDVRDTYVFKYPYFVACLTVKLLIYMYMSHAVMAPYP